MAHHTTNSGRQFIRLLLARQGKRIVLAVVLMLAAGLSSGGGFLLLVPLLQGLDVSVEAPLNQGVSGTVARLFSVLGTSLTLPGVLLVYALLAGSYVLLTRWGEVLSAKIEQDFTASLRNELFAAVSHAGWQFLVGRRRADLAHALAWDLRRAGDGTVFLLRLLNALAITLTHLAVCFAISPVLSALTVAGGVVLGLLLQRRHQAVRAAGERATLLHRGFFAHVTEHLAGLKEAQSFAAEDRHVAAFEQLTGQLRAEGVRYARIRSGTTAIHALGAIGLLCGLLYLAVGVFAVAFSQLAVAVLIFARIMPRFQDLHACYAHLAHMLPAFESARRLQAQCESSRRPGPLDRTQAPALDRGLTLRGVRFRYEPGGPWVLHDLNLTLPAGSITTVMGPSGSGKSTLADLLIGLLQPESGEIHVDGRRLDGPQSAAWRERIGYVPQETFLLRDTVAANLRWAHPAASDRELWGALEMAAAADFVRALPQGLETVVGDRGARLSGGQRQRLALARAFLRRPTLLVLDEATSSLDPENRDRLLAAIEGLHGARTVLIIAHDLPAVRIADQIVVLENGRVAQSGTCEELGRRGETRLRSLIAADGHESRRPG